MTVPNVYGVPQRQWNKWHEGARHVFNTTFSDGATQSYILPPDTPRISPEVWEVIRWNFAFCAACNANKIKVQIEFSIPNG